MVVHDVHYLGLTATAWDVVGSAAAGAGLLLGGLAAVYAARQYQHARKVHLDQTRPYMVITAEASPTSMHVIDLVVRNVGSTPAHKVSLRVSPRIEVSYDDPGMDINDSRLFTDRFDMWPPGFELRCFFDSHFSRDGLGDRYEVIITYTDGRAGRWQETNVIDLNMLQGLSFTETYGVHHAASALRDIAKAVKGAAVFTKGELSVTTEDREVRKARMIAEREASRLRRVAYETKAEEASTAAFDAAESPPTI